MERKFNLEKNPTPDRIDPKKIFLKSLKNENTKERPTPPKKQSPKIFFKHQKKFINHRHPLPPPLPILPPPPLPTLPLFSFPLRVGRSRGGI